MGSHVAASILSGDVGKAKKLSLLINIGGKAIESFVKSTWAGKTIILGGDDVMMEIPAGKFDPGHVEQLRALYAKKTKATLSVGIGSTPEEAMQAIVIAKNTGKNKAVFWADNLKAKYKEVVAKRLNDMRTKLRAAGGLVESESIPPELRKHVRREVRKLLKSRVRNNRKAKSTVKKAKPSSSGAAQKPDKAKHQQDMITLLRGFILHHKAVARNFNQHANALMATGRPGDLADARALRMKAKLQFKSMLRNRAVLHAAAQMRDPSLLPPGMKSTVRVIRTTLASKIRRERSHARKVAKLKSAPVAPTFGSPLPVNTPVTGKSMAGGAPKPPAPAHPANTVKTPKFKPAKPKSPLSSKPKPRFNVRKKK